MSRKNGLLAPLSSLPNRHGIGDFGLETKNFLPILKTYKCDIWQILPLNKLGYGNSPYQPLSSYAIDEIYISLDELVNNGLLTFVPDYRKKFRRINYDLIRRFKNYYLKKAYLQFQKNPSDDFVLFKRKKWVQEYSKYMIIRNKKFNLKNNSFKNQKEEADYLMWLQFIAYEQLNSLKKYANKNNILLLGDLPLYVGLDSSDVYFHKKEFLLDEYKKPILVAGVPPDYFSSTGQLWGNPIYNYEYAKKNNYKFLTNRIKHASFLYDIVRIDHFRGLDSYYAIPSNEKTAENGMWCKGPGKDLLNNLFKKINKNKIVVEDLGDLFPSVIQLRDAFHLKGMKVLQFHLLSDLKSQKNMIYYSGTHDNEMMKSWWNSLSLIDKKAIRTLIKKNNIKENNIYHSLLMLIAKSECDYKIYSLGDLMLLNNKNGRINTPSTLNNLNWTVRYLDDKRFMEGMEFFKKLCIMN